MKKKIVKADQTDKQQIRKDKTAIFSGGLEIMFQNLDFEGGNLIKILEKHEKLIQKQAVEERESFETFLKSL